MGKAARMARFLPDVIDQIIAVAPDLADALRSTKESAMYAAPEMQSHWWRQAADMLNTYAANHPKRQELAAIFSGTAHLAARREGEG